MILADSMIAVPVSGSHHQGACCGRWAASNVETVNSSTFNSRLNTSPKPSPPSLMGNRSNLSSGRASCQPAAINPAAARAVNVPLNLSGTINTFSGMRD